MERRQFLVMTIPFILAGSPVFGQQSDFKLTIARKYSDSNCTSGYLAVNDKIIAYTLEKPWQGNAPLISSIPDGAYGGILRYDHADKWRIELTGVPGRTHVQIHTGNTPDDSEGCILVGLKLGGDMCSVLDSKSAYAALRTAFYGTPDPVATPDKNIIVSVVS
ncbi:hypothetical protein HFO84_32900 [Rhizobium leguminosarum]|uniref:DUF5675 family protein n=1 Tax=Rhizobium leguminosarum TaxID=384 RepID=UPI001C97FE1E|nr:DUF5675 family protein [Rhizobium leguminosarum]MBY5482086.1 hypothetical protein [Rhizobium leguminosarum]